MFYTHFRGDPWFNMGFDEWMLGSVLKVPGLFLARLYTWSVGTITFGRNQREETALAWSKLGRTPVVRRVTGGRAVFHDPSELTYSLALNPNVPGLEHLRGSVAKTSAALAQVLVDFAAVQGVSAEMVARSSVRDARPEVFHKAPCFASNARHELVAAGGRKIVASAQRQIEGVILQHGSIKLHGIVGHPALDDLSTPPPSSDSTVVREATFHRAAEALKRVLADRFRVSFESGEPTASERLEIERAAESVRLAPLARRAVVKQTALSNSL
jgi:lipoate-protein ligase A